MSQHIPSHVVLLCCELRLSISGSIERYCPRFEGVKVGGTTAEGNILELEEVCGGLCTYLISQSQDEEVYDLDNIRYRFELFVSRSGRNEGSVADKLDWDKFETVGRGVLLGVGLALELQAYFQLPLTI